MRYLVFSRFCLSNLLALFLFSIDAMSPTAATAQEFLHTERFGDIAILRPKGQATDLAILLDGAGTVSNNSNKEREAVIEGEAVQRTLLAEKHIVAKIDVQHYLTELQKDLEEDDCFEVAGEFERLSQVIQKNIGLSEYTRPVLVGTAEGATIAYSVASEAGKSFKGAMILEPCFKPKLRVPLCNTELMRGLGKPQDLVVNGTSITAPIVVAGSGRSICEGHPIPNDIPKREAILFNPERDNFVYASKKMGAADTGVLVKNSFSLFGNLKAKAASNRGTRLPIVEIDSTGPEKNALVIFLSGDGGWASIDKAICKQLADNGYPVIGFDSLRYFWKQRSSAETAAAITELIDEYLVKYNKSEIVFIGYSFGADVLPFVINHLKSDVLAYVKYMVLLNPGLTTDFEVEMTDWLNLESTEGNEQILPEAQKITLPTFCVVASKEEESICRADLPIGFEKKVVPGSHHFDGDYDLISKLILERIGSH